MFPQQLDQRAHRRRDAGGGVEAAKRAQNPPVIRPELDSRGGGQVFGDSLVPVLGAGQMAVFVQPQVHVTLRSLSTTQATKSA